MKGNELTTIQFSGCIRAQVTVSLHLTGCILYWYKWDLHEKSGKGKRNITYCAFSRLSLWDGYSNLCAHAMGVLALASSSFSQTIDGFIFHFQHLLGIFASIFHSIKWYNLVCFPRDANMKKKNRRAHTHKTSIAVKKMHDNKIGIYGQLSTFWSIFQRTKHERIEKRTKEKKNHGSYLTSL